MKFLISYECKVDDEVFTSEFEFECAQEPLPTDTAIINKSREDSTKFFRGGLGAITSISVERL